MGTQRVQVKGICWPCLADARDFCSALAALVSPVKQNFSVLTINVPVVYMGRYEVVLRGDYP
jgi:hypothetical protein